MGYILMGVSFNELSLPEKGKGETRWFYEEHSVTTSTDDFIYRNM